MGKKVACEFEACESRVPVEDFDETAWLPVFKASRQHLGFFCPRHVAEAREGRHETRYLVTRDVDGIDEFVIDLKPLPPPEQGDGEAGFAPVPEGEGPS